MKKNKMMRLASVLLVAVLLSTSVISGTFAKYTTSGSSQDSARVAVWGVKVSANYSDFFKDEYTSATAYDDGISVDSYYGGDVIAPGTTGTLAEFSITGQPEVDVAITYDATLTFAGDWLADADGDDAINDEYCPIIFNVNGELFYIGATGISDMATLKAKVEEAIEKSAAKYNAGTDLNTVAPDDLAVSWLWQFDQATAGSTWKNANDQDDFKDTDLGNWLNNGLAKPEITLLVECTVTQID